MLCDNQFTTRTRQIRRLFYFVYNKQRTTQHTNYKQTTHRQQTHKSPHTLWISCRQPSMFADSLLNVSQIDKSISLSTGVDTSSRLRSRVHQKLRASLTFTCFNSDSTDILYATDISLFAIVKYYFYTYTYSCFFLHHIISSPMPIYSSRVVTTGISSKARRPNKQRTDEATNDKQRRTRRHEQADKQIASTAKTSQRRTACL